jgi:hypothetical protein
MTTLRLVFQCTTLLFLLIWCRGTIVSSKHGGSRLKRPAANAKSWEAAAPRQPPIAILRRLLLSHDKDNNNEDPAEVVDDLTEISIVDAINNEKDVFEETAKNTTSNKKEDATDAPTRAPHHHHHDDDDETKHKDKTPAPPTPAKKDKHATPPPTAVPKPEDRAKPEQQDNDTPPPTTTTTTTTKGEEGDDAYNEQDKSNHDGAANDDLPGQEATDDVPPEQDAPTKKPIHAAADDDDDEKQADIAQLDDDLVDLPDVEEELDEVETKAKVFGGFGFLIAIIAMIFTAHQMAENPDGIYASVCRLAITIVSCVFKAIFMPFRSLFGNRQYHGGHMPISTTEPYRSHAMELT